MICVYDMASGEQLQQEHSGMRPAPVHAEGPSDILLPTLQLQETSLIRADEPAWLKSDLMRKSIDSFFD